MLVAQGVYCFWYNNSMHEIPITEPQAPRETHARILARATIDPSDLWFSVLGHISDITMVIDREAHIKYINRVTEWLTIESVLGKDASEFIVPQQRAFFLEKIKETFEKGQAQHYHIKGFGDKGEIVEYASRIVPLVKEGVVQYAVVITLDTSSGVCD